MRFSKVIPVIFSLATTALAQDFCSSASHSGQSTKANSNTTGNIGGVGYELWADSGNNSATFYSDGSMQCSFQGAKDFLCRSGLSFDSTQTHSQIGHMYADFKLVKQNVGGADYSYVGIYGWTRNPLVEYYIVDNWLSQGRPGDWVGNQKHGDFTIDGAQYTVFENTRTGPSIDGDTTFKQYFSIRQQARDCGTIDITAHFQQWEKLGMTMGKMHEAKVLAEAGSNGGGASGSVDFPYAKVYTGAGGGGGAGGAPAGGAPAGGAPAGGDQGGAQAGGAPAGGDQGGAPPAGGDQGGAPQPPAGGDQGGAPQPPQDNNQGGFGQGFGGDQGGFGGGQGGFGGQGGNPWGGDQGNQGGFGGGQGGFPWGGDQGNQGGFGGGQGGFPWGGDQGNQGGNNGGWGGNPWGGNQGGNNGGWGGNQWGGDQGNNGGWGGSPWGGNQGGNNGGGFNWAAPGGNGGWGGNGGNGGGWGGWGMKKRQECSGLWDQCGGLNFKGANCCAEGECVKVNDYFHQCQKN